MSTPSVERRDFLVELGTEELPPKALGELETAFREGIVTRLGALGLKHGAVESFAAPRRLAVRVRRLALRQADARVQRRGPPVSAAFDAAGAPTRAAQAFAQSCGVAIEALGRERDPKGNECLSWSGTKSGADTVTLLPGVVRESLEALPIPKRMRWGAGEAEFVRPVHWLLMLFGREVVPATILDTPAGPLTRGHRFMAPKPIRIAAPSGYERALLTRGKVVARFAERRERIRTQVGAAATTLAGRALIGDALLDEVTALVEWPVAIAGRYEERFLALPREVLISTLQDHQRYFAVEDEAGRLMPWFITVANLESRDPAAVRAGNERVVRPRLSDAAFFWEQDRKSRLAARRPGLDAVTFQAKLGSIGAKVERVAQLARAVAAAIGGDAERAAAAAQLAKCDLLSAMVGEFPELQGIMGRYYALADGEPAEVAEAIAEHYQPRGAADGLPQTRTGIALAIADKLDTLAGIFAIGQKPTGARDPFGLRRAAIGVLRIVLEKRLELDLAALIDAAVGAQPLPEVAGNRAAIAAELYGYVMERLRAQYLEDAAAGVSVEMFEAVLATQPASPLDFDARLRALVAFLKGADAAALTAANKRSANILKKSESGPLRAVDAALLREDAERALHAAVEALRAPCEAALGRRDYAAAFELLATLRPKVDAFFDRVLVNDSDAALRANRFALLGSLRALFTRIADLSRLPG
ncbi:MAG: glycine--tRNA ligase subunit beta [Steroidobacteraceae bacterium]